MAEGGRFIAGKSGKTRRVKPDSDEHHSYPQADIAIDKATGKPVHRRVTGDAPANDGAEQAPPPPQNDPDKGDAQ
jgi:hypothetical protein